MTAIAAIVNLKRMLITGFPASKDRCSEIASPTAPIVLHYAQVIASLQAEKRPPRIPVGLTDSQNSTKSVLPAMAPPDDP